MDKINIQTIIGGDRFCDRGFGVNTVYIEISEEEYKRVTAIENWKSKLNIEYENMSNAADFGYGFYGCGVCKIESKYYFYKKIGNSCD